MARHGYQFTFEEILRLENPADNFGVTLAHLSIHKPAQIGYRGYHEMWISHSGQAFEKYEYAIFNHSFERVFQNPQFTIEQLIQLGNPADDDGDTVAHLMAKTGYIFTNNELMELGEQRNKLGETVADIMAHKNYKIPNSEVEKSDLPLEQLPINDYLDIKDSRPIYGVECPGWAYDFYFNGRVTYNYCDWGMDTMIKIMNQEAWSIYLDYLEKTYPGQIIDMKFVESIGKKYR